MALGQFCSVFHTLLQEAGAEDKTACMYTSMRFYESRDPLGRYLASVSVA